MTVDDVYKEVNMVAFFVNMLNAVPAAVVLSENPQNCLKNLRRYPELLGEAMLSDEQLCSNDFIISVYKETATFLIKTSKELFTSALSVLDSDELKEVVKAIDSDYETWSEDQKTYMNLFDSEIARVQHILQYIFNALITMLMGRKLSADPSLINAIVKSSKPNKPVTDVSGKEIDIQLTHYGHEYFETDILLNVCRKTNLW